jgi:ligand-binding sensor domain-containing protein
MNPKPLMERSAIRKPLLMTLPNAEGEARLYTIPGGSSIGRVSTLYQSADGVIWIGTANSGLTEFDGVRFRGYTVAQGLTDTAILTIAEDSEGGLWMGTYRSGAMRLARNGFVTPRNQMASTRRSARSLKTIQRYASSAQCSDQPVRR